jgi:hypothetical protein
LKRCRKCDVPLELLRKQIGRDIDALMSAIAAEKRI